MADRRVVSGRAPPDRIWTVPGLARLDIDRARRVGIPEVILGEGKAPAHLAAILRALVRRGSGALVSRPAPEHAEYLRRPELAEVWRRIEVRAGGRLWRLAGPIEGTPIGGCAAVLAAGTADVPVAEEAAAALEALGVRVERAYDVGVAGLHRLRAALRSIRHRSPQAYIVCAGREGALAPVVAGLVPGPVIGVPVSVGYGRGGRGEAALLAMLQACAPLVVVNIDAAIPAALVAAQICRQRRPAPVARR